MCKLNTAPNARKRAYTNPWTTYHLGGHITYLFLRFWAKTGLQGPFKGLHGWEHPNLWGDMIPGVRR